MKRLYTTRNKRIRKWADLWCLVNSCKMSESLFLETTKLGFSQFNELFPQEVGEAWDRYLQISKTIKKNDK